VIPSQLCAGLCPHAPGTCVPYLLQDRLSEGRKVLLTTVRRKKEKLALREVFAA
jgi:hypothetical protein